MIDLKALKKISHPGDPEVLVIQDNFIGTKAKEIKAILIGASAEHCQRLAKQFEVESVSIDCLHNLTNFDRVFIWHPMAIETVVNSLLAKIESQKRIVKRAERSLK